MLVSENTEGTPFT